MQARGGGGEADGDPAGVAAAPIESARLTCVNLKLRFQIARTSDKEEYISITRNVPFHRRHSSTFPCNKISRVFWRAEVLEDDPCIRKKFLL